MQKSNLILAFLVFLFPARGATTTQFYAITKGQRYLQINAGTPTLQIQAPYRVRSLLYSTAPTTASVRAPNNANYNLTLQGDHMEFTRDYPNLPSMNNEWPQGNYTFTITSAADGTKNSVMNLSTDSYPLVPHISNFADGQAVNAALPFTITWDFLQRPMQDFVYLRIELNGVLVFETGRFPGAAGALNGFSTSATIPANALQSGRVYSATLTSWRAMVRDTQTIAGAAGQTAYTIETTFPIRTRFQTLDVRQYGFEKRVNFEQAAGVAILRTNAYELIAFANLARSNGVTAASAKLPSGAVRTLTTNGMDCISQQSFAASGLLEGAGNYEMTLATASNGAQTNRFNLPLADFPGLLQISNIDQAQYIRPALPFTLSWISADGGPNDLIHFVIWEGAAKVYETPSVVGASPIHGGLRLLQIPPGTLIAGKSYTATLRLFRPQVVDSFTYPQAIGVAGYSRLVRFPMNTAVGATPQPLLESPVRLGNRTQLRFNSIRGETYRIECSQNLPFWTTAETIVAGDAMTIWLAPTSSLPAEFYRIVAGP